MTIEYYIAVIFSLGASRMRYLFIVKGYLFSTFKEISFDNRDIFATDNKEG